MYSITIAFIILYILTGEIKIAGGFTLVLEAVKLFQYFVFEKIWDKIKNRNDVIAVLKKQFDLLAPINLSYGLLKTSQIVLYLLVFLMLKDSLFLK